MFFPSEDWRIRLKKKTHALNQKYNMLTEEQINERKEILKEILGACKALNPL